MDDAVRKRACGFMLETSPVIAESGGGFSLVVRDGDAFEPLRTYPISEDFRADDAARQVVLDAEMEASGRGAGTYLFQLRAHKSGEKRQVRSMSFRVHEDGDDLGRPVGEDATHRGLAEQLMRHMEAKARTDQATLSTAVSAFAEAHRASLELVRVLGARLDEVEKTKMETIVLLKAIAERNEEREQSLQIRALREERIDKAIEKATAAMPFLLPAVLERFGLVRGEDRVPAMSAIAEAGEPPPGGAPPNGAH